MTFFQLLMLGASAFFAYKIYRHIQTHTPESSSSSVTFPTRNGDRGAWLHVHMYTYNGVAIGRAM